MSGNNSSGYTFYVEPITIQQDTQLVAIPTNNIENIVNTYDYVMNVNVAPRGTSLNTIFSNASYVWYSTNNTVGLNFTINTDFVNGVLNNSHTNVGIGYGNVPPIKFDQQEFTGSSEPIAMKLKEVMAVKIFGSAGAVSAFTSETFSGYSTNMPGLISSALNVVMTDSIQNTVLFDQYVSSGRFTQDQVNLAENDENDFNPRWVPFNFGNSVIDILMTLTGSVKDSINTVIDTTSYPTVHYPSSALIGGTAIPTSGQYAIPLLLRLHD